jgi:hypothetical protein
MSLARRENDDASTRYEVRSTKYCRLSIADCRLNERITLKVLYFDLQDFDKKVLLK